jgi:type IV secretion system protein VirD4
MRSVLAGNDFSLRDLKAAPEGLSVYLVLPATRMGLCNRWLRLFVNQLLDAMEKEKAKPNVPVLVCLDEFPVLGFMQQLQDAAGQIASFDVRLWIIMQDWGQGKALYGDRFESFIANAGIFQAFGNVDVQTTEYLSKKLGQTFIEDPTTTSSQPTDPLAGMASSVRQHYPLLTPDEITKCFSREDPLKRQLIMWAGYDPIILQRIEYFDPETPLAVYL